MAEEKQKVYTEQEVRDVIKRMNNFGPQEGEIAVCRWNPNLEKWISNDKYQMTVREILEQHADLRNRVEGLECGEDWIVVPLELWNRQANRINATLRVLGEEDQGFRQIDFKAHGYDSIRSRILHCIERLGKAIRGEKDGN